MKITALEEYGLRCMMQLAINASDRPVTVAEVAEAEGISNEYAGKLLNLLRQAGLARSLRGRNGGFELARGPEEVRLADIIRALSNDLFDEEYCERHSGTGESCVHSSACSLRPVWATLSEMINEMLESLTLVDLMRSERQLSRQLEPRIGALPERSPDDGERTLHQVRVRQSSRFEQ